MITAERVYEVFGIFYPTVYKGINDDTFVKVDNGNYEAGTFGSKSALVCLLKASPEMLVTFVNTVIELDDRSYYINSYNLLVKAIESADSKKRKWPELLKELEKTDG